MLSTALALSVPVFAIVTVPSPNGLTNVHRVESSAARLKSSETMVVDDFVMKTESEAAPAFPEESVPAIRK